MNPNVTGLVIVTKKYEAMKQFFVDLGIDIISEHEQIPQYGEKGVIVDVPSLPIILEECIDMPPSGPVYLEIKDVEESRLLEMKRKYSVKQVKHFFGVYYNVKSPDGGIVKVIPKKLT